MDQEVKWIRDTQRHGSRAAAEALISSYYDEIYRFAYRQTGNREDAMDLTQNIFLAVLWAIHSYNGKKATFHVRNISYSEWCNFTLDFWLVKSLYNMGWLF